MVPARTTKSFGDWVAKGCGLATPSALSGSIWATMDPTGFAGGDANLYLYARLNPVNAIYPTGLDCGCGAVPPGPAGASVDKNMLDVQANLTSAPCGCSSQDSDNDVLKSAVRTGNSERGSLYTPTGGNNSNKSVNNVIRGARGNVPTGVEPGFNFEAPGMKGP